jgi:glucose/arabinose dehydrogenase
MLRFLSALFVALAACASAGSPQPEAASALPPFDTEAAITIPRDFPLALLKRTVVARGLGTPRAMVVLSDGSLLVSEAGSGAPDDARSGTLSRLTDRDGDGDFLDEGEREVLLGQPSKDIREFVGRDGAFAMGAVARGGETVLAALDFVGGPSALLRVDGDEVSVWAQTQGTVDDLAYAPRSRQWYAVSSTSDEVVRLQPDGSTEQVVKIPLLPSGQHPAPGYIEHDPLNGHMLVSLFGGSPQGQEGGEIAPRAGAIISVDPATKRFSWTVRGLTAPTDLAITSEASIYVLEHSNALPEQARATPVAEPSRGEFERFSGRLLRVDRMHRRVTLVATGLDAPTNLALGHLGFGELRHTVLYVAQDMGPAASGGPEGVVPLTGFIERMSLTPGRDAPEE